MDLACDCASLPRSVEARPCKDDHDSQSPEDAVAPFALLVEDDLDPSHPPLLFVLAAEVGAWRLEGFVAGIGEMPRGELLGGAIEMEEDDTAPSAAGSKSFSSWNEMSLLLRGRIVDVALLGKRVSLLLIVAALADGHGVGKRAFADLQTETPTCQLSSKIRKKWNRRG